METANAALAVDDEWRKLIDRAGHAIGKRSGKHAKLVGERLHVPVRTVWRGLAAAGVVVVLVLAWLLFVRDTPGQAGVVVREPVTFNLIYTDAMRRVAPRTGETLRLQTRAGAPQSFAVRPLRLAPYKGDVSATLTLLSARLIREMSATYPGFLWRRAREHQPAARLSDRLPGPHRRAHDLRQARPAGRGARPASA